MIRKHRIYIDEVGNPDLKNSDDLNHRFLCLSGVIFDLEYVSKTFQPQLEKLKEKYFEHHPDEPTILHRKELKIKNKTANIAGLQLADLIAHPVRRYGFEKFWNIKEDKKTFADEVISILVKENKIFNYKGKINGFGIKKLP